MLQIEHAVLFQKHEKQKTIQNIKNYPIPQHQAKTRKREKKIQVKVKVKEKNQNSSPQYGHQFVSRINHSYGQDHSP